MVSINQNFQKYFFILLFFTYIEGIGIVGDDSVGSGLGMGILWSEQIIPRFYQSDWPLYLFPTQNIHFEVDYFTLSFVRYNKGIRFNYLNPTLMAIASCFAYFQGESFLKPGIVATLIGSPHVIGNNKICFSIIKKHLFLFLGINTDYYLYIKKSTIFSELKAGGKCTIGPVVAEVAASKPWLKGYLESSKPALTFSLGYYNKW